MSHQEPVINYFETPPFANDVRSEDTAMCILSLSVGSAIAIQNVLQKWYFHV